MSEFVLDETERIHGGPGGLRVLSIALVIIDGPSRGLRARLDGAGKARVGTAEGSTLRLADRSASRIHCELEVREDVVTLRDLGSTNGTFLGEVRVRDVDVRVGAAVRCGSTTFTIEAVQEPTFLAISERGSFGELVGKSFEMRRVYAVLERVASSGTTLLVQGETGTGKDVVARSVHAASPRAAGPFVPVDCGSIPETLFESELFGHVRGAFTGAIANRAGAFEEAHGGTLFLDEIGELPLELQPKLLRALEAREVRRVGQSKMKRIDVRVIAATNRDLEREVNRGRFREDLYYRLAKVSVRVPPLRDRLEDIPVLVKSFLASLGGRDASRLFSTAVVEEMQRHDWPGNVRELKNYVERSVVLDDVPPPSRRSGTMRAYGAPAGEGIDARDADARLELRETDTPRGDPTDVPFRIAKEAAIASFERSYLGPLIDKCNGNVSQAARAARMDRMYLHQLAQKHGFRVGRK